MCTLNSNHSLGHIHDSSIISLRAPSKCQHALVNIIQSPEKYFYSLPASALIEISVTQASRRSHTAQYSHDMSKIKRATEWFLFLEK